jgi:hypothetical protein
MIGLPPPVRTYISVLLLSVAAAACTGELASTVAVPDAPPDPAVATLSVAEFARTAEHLKGRTVRVCGGRLSPYWDAERRPIGWFVAQSSVAGYHPAIVNIGSCGAAKPKLEAAKCLTGRVARPDGSLNTDNWNAVITSSVENRNWYLHPLQCRAAPSPR